MIIDHALRLQEDHDTKSNATQTLFAAADISGLSVYDKNQGVCFTSVLVSSHHNSSCWTQYDVIGTKRGLHASALGNRTDCNIFKQLFSIRSFALHWFYTPWQLFNRVSTETMLVDRV